MADNGLKSIQADMRSGREAKLSPMYVVEVVILSAVELFKIQ